MVILASLETYQVVLLVLMIAAFLYIVVLLYVAGHGMEFAKRLRARTKALLTLMSEKRRLLLLLDGELRHYHAAYEESDEEAVSALKSLNLMEITYKEAKDTLSFIGRVETRLRFLGHDLDGFEKDPQCEEWLASLEEIDHSIRRGTSFYNMEAAALNYWVSIPMAGWINYLFGIKKRDPIV
ncbi:MAG: hypothetical protein ACI32C_04510 [Candidatus Enteromonas sp.]